MKPIILFRKSLAEENEFQIASKYFNITESRNAVPYNSLVIPRYSALPYYNELEYDLLLLNSKLVNSYVQHRYIASLINYYNDLGDLTPKTWFDLSSIPNEEGGSFTLKGETNSKKNLWNTHMFAENRADIMRVYLNLLNDSLISSQGICIRKFVKLQNYGLNEITKAPISKEFRCFFYGDRLLAKGFYWSQCLDMIDTKPDPNEVPDYIIKKVASLVAPHINFWVADIAQREDGKFIIIELNDGSQSGLCCINPDELYSNLQREFING